MIHILREKATDSQIEEMLEVYGDYIKLAVDIRQGIIAGGGEYHSDCEEVLVRAGSDQGDIWGAGWVPSTGEIKYEAMLNLKPVRNNPAMIILDKGIRGKVAEVVSAIFGNG